MTSLPRRIAFLFLALFVAGLLVVLVRQWVQTAVAGHPAGQAVADAQPVVPPAMTSAAATFMASRLRARRRSDGPLTR